MNKEYEKEMSEAVSDCSNWDSENLALKEVFRRGVEFQKVQTRAAIEILYQQDRKMMMGLIAKDDIFEALK